MPRHLRLIVAPELREKTVAPVSDVDLPVAVLACAIAPFKSARLIVLSLTVAVARDANEFAENWLATLALFPAVNNVFNTEAVPVRAVTESAVIVPDVYPFKVSNVLASETFVSVIVTFSYLNY